MAATEYLYRYDFPYRVRYADTDQMGVMYYGHYPRLLEIGRVEAMRSLGLRYADLEAQDIVMPVLEMNIQYKRPVIYDERLTLRTEIRQMPDRDISFYTDIINERNKCCTIAVVTLCFYDNKNKKRLACIEEMKEALCRVRS